MQDRARFIGGVRIGLFNASSPFARITADREKLVLSVLLARYSFAPDQVVAIEKYSVIPLLGSGLRIRHVVADYPKTIVFWYLRSPEYVMRRIQEVGFVPSASPSALPRRGGTAVRWQSLVAMVVVWNALFLTDMWCSKQHSVKFCPLALAAFVLFSAAPILILRFPALGHLLLKPGRRVGG